ncbi:efflux RND transporter periplasmic adaptor subunit [Pseudothauera nasutitermitis]|uniref:Efflux RND transporter periplasmic adaptor subunit n=1 Tax=Pseudothauera nasutitermitis TaxID=2565930 RepID=A0A4S4AWJ3_9RHOO|nr:efflux RND transporter periplasmic adaptor subunit [Pseudothauera nasutitermitis]THF63625.1 efflux RND transporter periplasmic adaptor subunit [Pseudothauera nasutitermitis]
MPAGRPIRATLSLLAALLLCAQAPAAAQTAQPPAAHLPALEQREIRAQLAPRRYTTLAAEIGARIQRMPVPEGGTFKQGQNLVQFDCVLQQAQLDRARAALDAADKTWQANRRLAELGSAGQVELDISAAETRKARAEVAAGSAVLGKCNLPAPYPGRIAEQRVREQQYVQPGQALLDIIDDSVLELEFIVPSRWLVWLKAGARFEVRIDETGKTYPASVQRIGARVDPVSQSIKINAVIDGRFEELIAGMSGQVLMAPPTH